MNILILNGPNINMLGKREPELYGQRGYDALVAGIEQYCQKKDVRVSFFQSNHEGALIDRIQEGCGEVDGIVFNPAAYTHTSVALLDAIKAVAIPTVEVHLTDISSREDFRQISYIRQACIATISGHGFEGYLEAIDLLLKHLKKPL